MNKSKSRIFRQPPIYLPFTPNRQATDRWHVFFEQLLIAISWCIEADKLMVEYRMMSLRRVVPDNNIIPLHVLMRGFVSEKIRQGFVDSVAHAPMIFKGFVDSFNHAYNKIAQHVITTPLFLTVIPHALLTHDLVYMYVHDHINHNIRAMARSFLHNALVRAGPNQFCDGPCGIVINYCFDV